MDIKELSTKIDEYHKEDKRKAAMHQWWNVAAISFGFAITMLSIYKANPSCMNHVFVYIFWIAGGISTLCALFYPKFKEK